MFGLSALELRLACYGVLLAAICGLLLYERYQGYEACRAPQVAAEKAQVQRDLDTAKGTIHDLNARLAAITPPKPAPVLRLCPSSGLRANSAPQGAQPAVAQPVGESATGMSGGDSGSDFGPAVQDSERSAEVLAIYRHSTWEWANKQAEPVKR